VPDFSRSKLWWNEVTVSTTANGYSIGLSRNSGSAGADRRDRELVSRVSGVSGWEG
jgi:hypothetical protein